jgi:hypothetical protein
MISLARIELLQYPRLPIVSTYTGIGGYRMRESQKVGGG